MIAFYHHPLSPASQRVRLVLEEKEIDYDARFVDLPAKENLDAWYLKLNPMGALPTIVVDGTPISESSIICEYLEERFGDRSLAPSDPLARAQMRNWMKHVDDQLHYAAGALVWTLIMRPGVLERPAEERAALLDRIPDLERRKRHKRWVEQGLDSDDFPDAIATFHKTIKRMETELAKPPWLAGETFTLADVALLPYIHALDQFSWRGLLAGAPSANAWFNRARKRQSYQRAIVDQIQSDQRDQMQRVGAAQWPKIAAELAVDAG